MPKEFIYSDPHFGHANICKFTNYDGSKVRPWDDVAEMDKDMIRMYNETVPVDGKVYWLGDCVINKKFLPTLALLNGDKVLIKGNHDIFKISEYLKYFRDIRSYHVLNGMILSHIPIHVDSIARFGTNIHGHLHGNQVMMDKVTETETTKGFWPFKKKEVTRTVTQVPDPRYFCACVEHTGFKPIAFTEVLERIKERGGHIGFRNGNGPQVD